MSDDAFSGHVERCRDERSAQRLSDIGAFDVEERDFVWAEVDGLALHAHSYRPKGAAGVMLPAAIDVHGGAWNLHDRMAGQHYDRALASSGLNVMAVDFRQGPDHHHPEGSRDVTGAVRYLRSHAAMLGIDPDSIGVIGSSSGGHLALLAAIEPDADMHRGTTIRMPDGSLSTASDVSAGVAYVIGLWPVSDPAYRYAYAKEVGRAELVKAHDNYFVTEANMHRASIARVIEAGEAVQALPAALIVQPGEDANVPRAMTAALVQAYQEAGGYLEYVFFPGQPHGFAHRPSATTDDCIRAMRSFISRRLQAPVPGGAST